MSERDDGGPAFPSSEKLVGVDSQGYKTEGLAVSHGMSLRDWFAGEALPAVLQMATENAKLGNTQSYKALALEAYMWAEAMLYARKADLTEPPKSG